MGTVAPRLARQALQDEGLQILIHLFTLYSGPDPFMMWTSGRVWVPSDSLKSGFEFFSFSGFKDSGSVGSNSAPPLRSCVTLGKWLSVSGPVTSLET